MKATVPALRSHLAENFVARPITQLDELALRHYRHIVHEDNVGNVIYLRAERQEEGGAWSIIVQRRQHFAQRQLTSSGSTAVKFD
jgi:hypothetical protein